MPHDFDTDHHFTGDQQAQYDSLSAKGRTLYDTKRWYQGYTHEEAFKIAKAEHGLKSPELLKLEDDLAKLRMGIDPRISW